MNRLKQLRIEKKLLQSDIAKIIGKTDRAVGQYEREERDPGSKTWTILADYFEVSLDYLLGKTDIRNTNKEDDPLGLSQIGFNIKDYNPPTETQKEQIKSLIEIILKDNKKDTHDKR